MSDETKNMLDIILQALTIFGGAIAFWVGLRQYQQGQHWLRAEKMDKMVEEFESNELLQLATKTVDWTRRTVKFRGEDFTITNTDALLGLRDHSKMGPKPDFQGKQATLRDAYDTLLAFLPDWNWRSPPGWWMPTRPSDIFATGLSIFSYSTGIPMKRIC